MMIQQITAAKPPILIALTPGRSRIFHEAHETEVHVELHVAMIQGETGIIGNEIDFDALAARHIDRVLENAGRRFSCDPSQLKRVAVEVHRMIVSAFILHGDSIALPGLDD
jgi:hypothetical protein